jgi:CheY-like chemotaxis protein
MLYNYSSTLVRQVFENIRQIESLSLSGLRLSNGRRRAWLMLMSGREAERKNALGREPGARAEACNQEHTTILLVEDDKFVREATCEALLASGFRVLTSNSASEAMRQFRTLPACDLLITDIVLPDGRGHQLAKQLLVLSPALAVIYVSGYPGGMNHGRTDEGSHSCYLQKPFSKDALLEKIRQVLAHDLTGGLQSAVTPACGMP